MALFLSLGFPLFALLLSLSLCQWKNPFLYFASFTGGMLAFLLSWLINYLLKNLYQMTLSFHFFDKNTLPDQFFDLFLLLYLPLTFLSYLLFALYPKSTLISPFASLYFWWMGFFSSFSLYILLQTSSSYSFFEYLIMPLLLSGFFVSLFCSLSFLKKLTALSHVFALVSLTLIFSLPSIFFQSLYFQAFWISCLICLLISLFALTLLLKYRKK